jgi:hypothetical protein
MQPEAHHAGHFPEPKAEGRTVRSICATGTPPAPRAAMVVRPGAMPKTKMLVGLAGLAS